MSDVAFYPHYDQHLASAYHFSFTHCAPLAGFIVLAAYLFMFSSSLPGLTPIVRATTVFQSRTAAVEAKLITFYAINGFQ